MNLFSIKYAIILAGFLLIPNVTSTQVRNNKQVDFNQLSETFLQQIKAGQDTGEIRKVLENTSLEALESGLQTDSQKLAFWINIYNGYIQVILSDNPELYDDRRSFFAEEQIPIAGRMLSFAKIEHGIIRKSQWEYGLGYIRKWFPDKFERKLRVEDRDWRIHFALNCGAKDCPPVAIYQPGRLDAQLDKSTARYLDRTTTYQEETKTAEVTTLFKWFKGDFGCNKGVKEILANYNLIPMTRDVELEYKNYDWTLDLDNFIKL
ncbi:DUF547 domain-containing protein [Zeaxanthinibacter sp. PT1]|uniref:DUF547 domain-containing protein n=1 Tax=Zeaxanthinibacter TaxID=561554 RepID=UPI00234B8F5F|nr:DUF547 domain-containing protein [Zeaxanthinibacter sp. PT1]MDC6352265.1 DUF547 domain-containing protein [Zeaxanthinibacter sp. PT1]